MLEDIKIAQNAELKPISQVAKNLGVNEDELYMYGKYKAKLSNDLYSRLSCKEDGKLILVTAVNPTPAGEGKTTITVGLGQALAKIGESVTIALREPSLGPVFGIKGGATGGGYSQVVPMEDINLHFTGDMHAITAANNLLCAAVDNHIQQGNKLSIDQRNIKIKRCIDMNDRALRNVVIGLGGKINGVPREESFIITVASEVMAILCLAEDINDLKVKLGNIIVAYNLNGDPIYAKDIGVQGAMAALLKDAINPNLVQTLEGVPAIMHGGPFANIAHGCNSVRATKLALKLSDYCVTEAGFGADLGAEKFLDIKCRLANLNPSVIVIVVTSRALKYNGGCPKNELKEKNLHSLEKGICNLGVHIENMKKYNVPVIVAINKFENDDDEEIEFIKDYCKYKNTAVEVADVFSKGGEGGKELALKVYELSKSESKYSPIYSLELGIKEKINIIAKEIYRAGNVVYSKKAEKAILEIEKLGTTNLPICIAKTQYSLSDDPLKLGAPSGFAIEVKDIAISNGAGFIVVYTGDIMVMPGLPKVPAAEKIDVDEKGKISGLF